MSESTYLDSDLRNFVGDLAPLATAISIYLFNK